MGLRFRKQIGPKGLKLNIGKKGINSTSIKIAKGITYNSKRGLTVGIPGTGFSYNFCGKKKQAKKESAPTRPALSPEEQQERHDQWVALKKAKQERSQAHINARLAYNKGFKEFTGGYNKKPLIATGISLVLCLTPVWLLGLVLMIPFLVWFLIDTLVKMSRYKKHLKENIGVKQNPRDIPEGSLSS